MQISMIIKNIFNNRQETIQEFMQVRDNPHEHPEFREQGSTE
jgi:hypothetical protein